MKRTIGTALVAVAIVLGSASCGSSPRTAVPSAPAATSTPQALPTPAVEVPVAAATLAPARQAVPPVRVAVASLGVDMSVQPVGVEEGGFMQLPVDPSIAGWYQYGSDPSSPDGNVVISAHVDAPDYPIGPFSRLRELAAGAEVSVTDAAGIAHRYAVTSVAYVPKTELPVADLFARSGTRALVLITCGGEYDAAIGRYEDNVVALATPVE